MHIASASRLQPVDRLCRVALRLGVAGHGGGSRLHRVRDLKYSDVINRPILVVPTQIGLNGTTPSAAFLSQGAKPLVLL